MSKMLLALAAACVLAGCSSATPEAKVDINKVADVKSSFDPISRSATSANGESIPSCWPAENCPTD